MKGRLIIIPANGEAVRSKDLATSPPLEELQEGVGDDIEIVPGFTRYQGKHAVAFCGEHGKLRKKPFNHRATALWYRQLDPKDMFEDYIAGAMVIVTGDRELMEAL